MFLLCWWIAIILFSLFFVFVAYFRSVYYQEDVYCNRRGGGGVKGTPYSGLYGEAPPERGTFFRLQVYKRVGISQVEVHNRVEISVI